VSLGDLLAERGLVAPVESVGDGVARVVLADAAARWSELRGLPGWHAVLDGGGLVLPDADTVGQTLAMARVLDGGTWLRRRKTVYEPDELPAEGAEPAATPSPAEAILFVPTDVPWAAGAILGLETYHVCVHRRWYELYGAELCWAGAGAVELTVARPPETLVEAMVLAREHLAYSPGVLAEPTVARAVRAGAHPLEAIAAARVGLGFWSLSLLD
jgi:hypothetical protein